jgi:hypothetical protein
MCLECNIQTFWIREKSFTLIGLMCLRDTEERSTCGITSPNPTTVGDQRKLQLISFSLDCRDEWKSALKLSRLEGSRGLSRISNHKGESDRMTQRSAVQIRPLQP